MAGTHDHFWAEVLGRPAEGVRLVFVVLDDLRESEVRKHDVTVSVHQDVLGLEVSVEDLAVVEVPQSQRNLGGIKLGLVLGEALHLGQVLEELPSLNEVHHKVNPERLLEDVVHPNDERVVHLQQNQLLNQQ